MTEHDGAQSELEEQRRIQRKQGGHHMPPRPDDGPPLDDTDRNTDKIIDPVKRRIHESPSSPTPT
jgi:hypothetical protein